VSIRNIPANISSEYRQIVDNIQDNVDHLPLDDGRMLVRKLREFLWQTEDSLEFEPSDGDLLGIEIEHHELGCPLVRAENRE
jgi:hypothetical protein